MGINSGRTVLAFMFIGGAALMCGPVRADDASDLAAKRAAASATIRSSQVTITGRSNLQAMTGVTTMASLDRFEQVTTIGDRTISSYGIDGFLYVHDPAQPATPWIKFSYDKTQFETFAKQIFTSRQLKPLPDAVEDGVTVGMFEVTATFAPGMGTGRTETVTCSYDKQTYLNKRCASATLVRTYSHYNDPSLVVELPPEAKDAVLQPAPLVPPVSLLAPK
jgi:hypothetical protein